MAEFDITVTHPDYEEYASAWEMMRDTIDGEDEIKEHGEKYLPMKSGIKAMTDVNARHRTRTAPNSLRLSLRQFKAASD